MNRNSFTHGHQMYTSSMPWVRHTRYLFILDTWRLRQPCHGTTERLSIFPVQDKMTQSKI